MRGDTLALVEDLHGGRAHPGVDHLVDEAVGDAVEVAVDLDVVVDVDPDPLPLGELVGALGQRLEGGPVEALEEFGPGQAEVAHGAAVEGVEELADRLVEFGQGEEGAVAQPGQDPALRDEDAGLDLRLVARLSGPGGQDDAVRSGRRGRGRWG